MTLGTLIAQLANLLETVPVNSEVVIVYDSETCFTGAIRVDVCGNMVGIVGGVEEPPVGVGIPYDSGLSDEDKIIRFAAKQQAETVRQMIRERIEKNGR
jgi:hypothetical protein